MRSMRKLIVILSLVFSSGCIDEAKVTDFCEQKVDEAMAKVWEDCTDYYEEEILPDIQAQIDALIASLDSLLDAKVEQVLTDAGCVRDETAFFGWDCSASEVCQ